MKCFYHSADLDGHCSGAIVKYRHPECEMIGINYGEPFPFALIKPDEEVFIVDFCPSPFTVLESINAMCRLHWIDHHQTAIDESIKRGFMASAGGFSKVGEGACELTWKYLFSLRKPMPLAVHLLGRYDVFDLADDKVLPFQYGMRFFDETRPEKEEAMVLWGRLFTDAVWGAAEIIGRGSMILKWEAVQAAKFCRAYAFDTTLEVWPNEGNFLSYSAIAVNQGFTNSRVFESAYNPVKHDLMITFCRLPLPKKLWTVSLYSDKRYIHCGEIAKHFGGGGHKGAAGFQCAVLPFKH